MRGRKPKVTTAPSPGRARSKAPKKMDAQAVADMLQPPAPARDGKGRSPVGSARGASPFLSALRHCGSVTRKEQAIISAAGVAGFGLSDAASFWTFQFLRLESAHKGGTLDEKAYSIGLNQLLTAAVKLADIHSRTHTDDTPGEIRFVLDIAATVPGRVKQDPPGPNGDPIEVG